MDIWCCPLFFCFCCGGDCCPSFWRCTVGKKKERERKPACGNNQHQTRHSIYLFIFSAEGGIHRRADIDDTVLLPSLSYPVDDIIWSFLAHVNFCFSVFIITFAVSLLCACFSCSRFTITLVVHLSAPVPSVTRSTKAIGHPPGAPFHCDLGTITLSMSAVCILLEGTRAIVKVGSHILSCLFVFLHHIRNTII